jgi:hypothetical protein
MTTATATMRGFAPEVERGPGANSAHPEYDQTANKAGEAFKKGIGGFAGNAAEGVSSFLQNIDLIAFPMKGLNTVSERLQTHKENTSGLVRTAISALQNFGVEPMLGAMIGVMSLRIKLRDSVTDILNTTLRSAFPGLSGEMLARFNDGGENLRHITDEVKQQRDERRNPVAQPAA